MRLDDLRSQMHKKFSEIRWKYHNCGHGSLFENTEETRRILEGIAKKYDIKTVSDAGAGDLSWVYKTQWDVDYTPYDIRKWHPDVVEFDITSDVLPQTDLIICRHVLNHLPIELVNEALDRFEESGSSYLLVTCTRERLLPEVADLVARWGEPLEFYSETFCPDGGSSRTWNYGLFTFDSPARKHLADCLHTHPTD